MSQLQMVTLRGHYGIQIILCSRTNLMFFRIQIQVKKIVTHLAPRDLCSLPFIFYLKLHCETLSISLSRLIKISADSVFSLSFYFEIVS